MPTVLPALSIDVSKDILDVALWREDHPLASGRFANTRSGFDRLQHWISEQGFERVHVLMEATGRYGEDLAHALHEHGHTVSIINPVCIAGYAQSQLVRSKTDRGDAALIARYCWKERPAPWHPAREAEQSLRELTRAVEQLKRERRRLENQRQQAQHPTVREALRRSAEAIEQETACLEEEMARHIEADEALRRDRDLLLTIPGIGLATASVLLSEIGHARRFAHVRQVAAYAGLSVSHRDSGTSVKGRPRLSKKGSTRLRTAMYFPALAAMRHNEAIRALSQRLDKRGKQRKAIAGAAMRKLIHICYGVLKSGRPFDPALHPCF